MEIKYITEEDWREFKERYHSAYFFLLARSLQREADALAREIEHRRKWCPDDKNGRTDWCKKRLKDLSLAGFEPMPEEVPAQ